jgi:hypothetical protein
MKNEQPKKVEIMMNRKRYVVSEAAAKIAISTMRATEVIPFDKPKELKVKPPPIIQPEPIYKTIEVPEPIKVTEPLKDEHIAEPAKVKQTRKTRKK